MAARETCEKHGVHAVGACDRFWEPPDGSWHAHHFGIVPPSSGDFTPVSDANCHGDHHRVPVTFGELIGEFLERVLAGEAGPRQEVEREAGE